MLAKAGKMDSQETAGFLQQLGILPQMQKQAQLYSNTAIGLLDQNNLLNKRFLNASLDPVRDEFLKTVLPRIGSDAALSGQAGGTRGGLKQLAASTDYLNTIGNISAQVQNQFRTQGLEALPIAMQLIQQPGQVRTQIGQQRDDRRDYFRTRNDQTNMTNYGRKDAYRLGRDQTSMANYARRDAYRVGQDQTSMANYARRDAYRTGKYNANLQNYNTGQQFANQQYNTNLSNFQRSQYPVNRQQELLSNLMRIISGTGIGSNSTQQGTTMGGQQPGISTAASTIGGGVGGAALGSMAGAGLVGTGVGTSLASTMGIAGSSLGPVGTVIGGLLGLLAGGLM